MEFKEFSFDLLGSKIHILLDKELEDKKSQKIVQECYEECLRIDDWYSRFKDYNTLSLLNESIGEWQEVDDELFYIFSKAKEFEENTNGYFTLSTKEILENWGYDSQYQFNKALNNEEEFEENEDEFEDWNKKEKKSSKKISINSFEIDEEDLSVKLNSPIEFGGLGKGYALDCMVEICMSYKLDAFMISAGGDLYSYHKDSSKGFIVYLEHPTNEKEQIGIVHVNGFSLASSSSNRRKWDKYHHIVNPKTKEPANEMLSVYIQAQKGIDADSYATALFAMGFEKAKEILLKLDNIEGLLISNNFKIYKTKNFKCTLNKNTQLI
ncbi:MAG: FAD:protein FMN transferase [Nanoarchaeota archaeon]|nr:FAD:protein FMN transferase [Nanoarchaeota archaeon]